jgi:BirA family biotin operon repressor/biotin-[acetyl-CoA-carboxylase] ligase
MQIKKIYYQEIDSTNKEIERLNSSEGTVLIAETQTLGKGQSGRSWLSEKGGLYFSILVKPKENIHLIPLISGLSVVNAINKLFSFEKSNISIKWPNDVFWDNRKVSGTLVESKFKGNKIESCIVGVGINVNQNKFPEFEDNIPTSLKIISGKETNKELVLDEYLNSFFSYYDQLSNAHKIIQEVNNLLYQKNKLITVFTSGKEICGNLLGLNTDGALILKDENNKEHIIYSGRILK